MATLKTQPGDADVDTFIAGLDENRQADSRRLVELMQWASGEPPRLWGANMIGFGSYHYVYDSGREGDWFLCGFSPRKKEFSLYIMAGFEEFDALMQRLGRHRTGKSCLYVRKLDDIDMDVLEELLRQSVRTMRERYAAG